MKEYIIDGKNVKIDKRYPTYNIHIDEKLYQVASDYELGDVGKDNHNERIYLSVLKTDEDVHNLIKQALEKYLGDLNTSKNNYVIE
jgi:hypothetical protein